MDTQQEKIIVKIPPPPITSLIFEGGGVKGIAYAGAYKTLKEQKGLLDKLHWVAGSSAGAMTALLVALDFTPDEIDFELSLVDFSEFAQPPPYGKLATINFIFKNINKISKNLNHGINDGKKLYYWVQKIVEKKLTSKEATFLDLKKKHDSQFPESSEALSEGLSGYKNLFVIVTNAFKNKTEIFSWETTPHLQIADAVLASMSIPGFFYVRYIDSKKRKIDWNPTQEKICTHEIIPYVDGGVLNNYPINIFRDYKYWLPEYYGLVKTHHFNPSSLGLRVDSEEEVLDLIDIRYQEVISVQAEITDKESGVNPRMLASSDWLISPKGILSMTNKFVTLLTSDLDKVQKYCQRTIAIRDCNIGTTQFNLSEADKDKLKESGRKSVNGFLNEFFKKNFFTEISYNNRLELEKDIITKDKLIKEINSLQNKDSYKREFLRLELENKYAKEALLKLNGKYSRFFKSDRDASTSKISQGISLDSQAMGITQGFTEKIEEVPYVETPILQHEASSSRGPDQPIIQLKEDDGVRKSFLRRLCC